jgi:hypothetical protein
MSLKEKMPLEDLEARTVRYLPSIYSKSVAHTEVNPRCHNPLVARRLENAQDALPAQLEFDTPPTCGVLRDAFHRAHGLPFEQELTVADDQKDDLARTSDT